MSKHRSTSRRSARSVIVLASAAALSVMGVAFVVLLAPSSAPTAASKAIRPAEGVSVDETALRGFDRLVVYGHSMPTGGGASDPSLSYVEVAADSAGLALVNRAEGGTIAATAANTMVGSPSAGPQDAVIIHTGMNDIFRRGDEAVAMGREAIERLLTGTSKAKQRVLVLECQPVSWLDTPPQRDLQAAYDAWNAMLRAEAAAAGADVLETCADWDPAQFTDVAKYHPNDEGHALIAEEVLALLASKVTAS